MILPFAETKRPDRIKDEKNKDYHAKFARWSLKGLWTHQHREFVLKTLVNWQFFRGGKHQWILEDDLNNFLMDESGNPRDRLRFTANFIKPIVNQYIGNAVRLDFTAEASSLSDFVINVREKELMKRKFMFRAAEALPEFAGIINERFPLGETEQETEEIFQNTFTFDFSKAINTLIEVVEKDVDMEEIKIQLTRHLAMSGLGVYYSYEQNDEYMAEALDPVFFFHDKTALKPDLSDSEYMGRWYCMDTPSIFERWQNISAGDKDAIERISVQESVNINQRIWKHYNTLSNANGKIIVYESYWRDTEKQEYGYVMDDFEYPYFTRINHPESEFTTKDLIPDDELPDHAYQSLLGKDKEHGGNKRLNHKTIYVDLIRFATFIPKEDIKSTEGGDIILDWGELRYQDKQRLSPSNVKFPFKCYTYAYHHGDIISPLDDLLDIQRFANRTLSVAESQINSSRGAGTAISEQAISEKMPEDELYARMNTSDPIIVNTKRTGSIANSVGQYNSTIDNSTFALFDVVNTMGSIIQNVSGVNEAMTGSAGGQRELVGVIEQQIQRGTLVNEPFYYALTSILKQAYQNIASVGKRIYADNPRKLAIKAGDAGADIINITRLHKNSDFRVYVTRSDNKEEEKAVINQRIFEFRAIGMIDDIRAANLYNRATTADLANALVEFQKEKLEFQKRQAAMQQQDQQQQAETANAIGQQVQQEQDDQRLNDRIDKMQTQEDDLEKIVTKEQAKSAFQPRQ